MRLIKSMTAMLLCLLLLCACGKQEGPLPIEEQTVNQLLAGTENYLKIRVWDGQQTTLYWVEREENAIPAIDALKAVPVRPADDWSFDKIQLPFYSIHLPLLEHDNMEALWVNGYWIDQEGGVWTYDFDFETLIAQTKWARLPMVEDWNDIACDRYLKLWNGQWNRERMTPVKEPQPPENVTLTVTGMEDMTLRATVENKGSETWIYGYSWHLEVCLDGVWYLVPNLPTDRMSFPSLALGLKPGEILEQTFPWDLSYAPLPPGQYRVVFNGLTAEFTLE